MRDPRTSPKVGDEIVQPKQGAHLKVTAVNGDQIEWVRKSGESWKPDNSWTLSGWKNVVAKDADIVKRSA